MKKTYFENAQWMVTAGGIESTDRSYFIEKSRLGELREQTDMPSWPLHMVEKEWVDLDLFIEAFIYALQVHKGRYAPLPPDWEAKTRSKVYHERYWLMSHSMG
jgi:hypothetical protein